MKHSPLLLVLCAAWPLCCARASVPGWTDLRTSARFFYSTPFLPQAPAPFSYYHPHTLALRYTYALPPQLPFASLSSFSGLQYPTYFALPPAAPAQTYFPPPAQFPPPAHFPAPAPAPVQPPQPAPAVISEYEPPTSQSENTEAPSSPGSAPVFPGNIPSFPGGLPGLPEGLPTFPIKLPTFPDISSQLPGNAPSSPSDAPPTPPPAPAVFPAAPGGDSNFNDEDTVSIESA